MVVVYKIRKRRNKMGLTIKQLLRWVLDYFFAFMVYITFVQPALDSLKDLLNAKFKNITKH